MLKYLEKKFGIFYPSDWFYVLFYGIFAVGGILFIIATIAIFIGSGDCKYTIYSVNGNSRIGFETSKIVNEGANDIKFIDCYTGDTTTVAGNYLVIKN